MSTTTDNSTLKGKYDEAAGKVKQTIGEAFGSEKTANEGAGQQVKGNAEQAWGSVKEAAHDSKERNEADAHDNAHDIREKITSTAQNLKEKVQHGMDTDRNDR